MYMYTYTHIHLIENYTKYWSFFIMMRESVNMGNRYIRITEVIKL